MQYCESTSAKSKPSDDSSHDGLDRLAGTKILFPWSPIEHKVAKLVVKNKWRKLRKLFRKHGGIKLNQEFVVGDSGLTPLSIAVSCNAPIDIISGLIKAKDPGSPLETDLFGATPLHLACLNESSPEIVRLLVNHDGGQSVRIADIDNSTALHHAVENICLKIEHRYRDAPSSSISPMDIDGDHHHRQHDDHDGSDAASFVMASQMSSTSFGGSNVTIASDLENHIEIIRIICNKAPELVLHPNNQDDTPLDIPNIVMLKSRPGTPDFEKRLLQVYQVLKEASIRAYREQREKWEKAGLHATDSQKSHESNSLPPSLMSSNASSSAASSSLWPSQETQR